MVAPPVRLAAGTAHVPWPLPCLPLYIPIGYQHIWLEVVRGQPCLDI